MLRKLGPFGGILRYFATNVCKMCAFFNFLGRFCALFAKKWSIFKTFLKMLHFFAKCAHFYNFLGGFCALFAKKWSIFKTFLKFSKIFSKCNRNIFEMLQKLENLCLFSVKIYIFLSVMLHIALK